MRPDPERRAGSPDLSRAAVHKKRSSVLLAAIAVATVVWVLYANWLGEDVPVALSTSGHSDAAHRAIMPRNTSSAATPTGQGVLQGEASSRQVRSDDSGAKQQDATDDNLEERVRPIEAAVYKRGSGAIKAVLVALEDDDWRVRSRALDAAVNSYLAIPEEVLIDRAQFDPSPEVRFLALSGVAARLDPPLPDVAAVDPANARAISSLALNDPSEHVRWQAQQILDTLDGTQGAIEPDQANGLQ